MVCSVLGNIEKCINFTGVFFKMVKNLKKNVGINALYQSITHYSKPTI